MRIRGLFGAGGPLADAVPGYAPREGQIRLAEAIAATLAQRGTLVAEAGTGTGKTYAYLVPALRSGMRVIVSTGTRNLQDQLFSRDLPRVISALGCHGVRVALLKGRSNYLCLERAAHARPEHPLQAALLERVRQWAPTTRSGDLAEVIDEGEAGGLLSRITATADNCLGGDCPQFERCFIHGARRQAAAAQLVVVNHHLLLSDQALRDGGFGALLPDADAIIVDEAHQLPDLVSEFFGVRVSSRQLAELVTDSRREVAEFGDMPDLDAQLERLAEALGDAADCWRSVSERTALEQFETGEAAARDERLQQELAALAEQLDAVAERSSGLAACARRARQKLAALERLRAGAEGWVRWVEPMDRGRGGALVGAPVDTAELFREQVMHSGPAWVFTSATLSVGGDFSHFCSRLGLAPDSTRTLVVDSPFRYEEQARLLLPQGLGAPNASDYVDRWVAVAERLARAAGGGMFVLCTSRSAMRRAGARLRRSLDLTVLVQDEEGCGRAQLLERFVADGNAVLVGTSSFWHGVDVRGHALRVVLIDRLPFASPGDPLLSARIRAIRQAGGNPFRDLQLPQAILTLRQGMGRLIRDPSDRGLLVICDERVRTQRYGARVLEALPPVPVITDLEEACEWLAQIR